MHGNPVKEAVQRSQPLFGTWINLVRNPAILPLLQASGLDFARVDMEHASLNMESLADMALLARAIDFPIFVRPPEANREWITRLLDSGVWNLHCPQVDTADHAAAIVEAAYYAPMGSRGQAGNGPANEFETGMSMAERMAYANSQVFVTVMLETGGAFDHLEAIAAMPGIDALTLGPTDLAQDLGVYGTPDEGRILDVRRQMIIEAAKRHGKPPPCWSPATTRRGSGSKPASSCSATHRTSAWCRTATAAPSKRSRAADNNDEGAAG